MEIVLSLVGLIASLFAGVISYYYKIFYIKRKKSRIAEIKKYTSAKAIDFGTTNTLMTYSSLPDTSINYTEEIITKIEKQLLEKVNEGNVLNEELIKKLVDDELEKIGLRIKKIEDRFPDESKIEKIPSINDDILFEKIENLSSKIDAIENKILEKWDVALIVSKIIGGIFAVVAATYGVITYMQNQ